MLEFGAGSSTLFSMDRVARVVSLEHDPVWLAWARARIRGNVELIATVQEPAEAYRAPLGASGERFDLILVDGAHRNEAFADAVGRLAPGGVILLDDSHRSRLKPCFEAAAAAGLRHLHLEGHKPMSVGRPPHHALLPGRELLGDLVAQPSCAVTVVQPCARISRVSWTATAHSSIISWSSRS